MTATKRPSQILGRAELATSTTSINSEGGGGGGDGGGGGEVSFATRTSSLAAATLALATLEASFAAVLSFSAITAAS